MKTADELRKGIEALRGDLVNQLLQTRGVTVTLRVSGIM